MTVYLNLCYDIVSKHIILEKFCYCKLIISEGAHDTMS